MIEMTATPTTDEIILDRNFRGTDCQRCVTWAIEMLVQGYDADYLRRLAGQLPVYDLDAISVLRDRALTELGYDSLDDTLQCFLVTNQWNEKNNASLHEWAPPVQLAPCFKVAGWDGVKRFQPVGIAPDHPAYKILEYYSGLRVSSHGLLDGFGFGEDIAFGPIGDRRTYEITTLEQRLDVNLVGVAEFSGGYQHLWVASDHRFFSTNTVTDGVAFWGNGWDHVILNLLVFCEWESMPKETQESVSSSDWLLSWLRTIIPKRFIR